MVNKKLIDKTVKVTRDKMAITRSIYSCPPSQTDETKKCKRTLQSVHIIHANKISTAIAL